MSDPFAWTTDHWPAALLALVPALLNLTLLVCVLIFAKRNSLTYTFAAFVGTLTIWQFSDTLVRFSATQDAAMFWASLLGLGALLIAPAGMEFACQFTGKGHLVRRPWAIVVLWGPAVLIETAARAGLNHLPLVPDPTWAWRTEGPAPIVTQLYGIWIASLSLGILAILAQYAWNTPRTEPRRQQAILVAIGFAVPTIQGTITEVLFPTFLGLPNFPVASTAMTAFSVLAFIALRRHEFLQVATVEEQLVRAKSDLERERQTLELAEKIAHLGSWDWDLRSGEVTWSPEMYRLYGVERGSFRPDRESIQRHLHPEDRDTFLQSLAQATEFGTPFEFEYRILRQGGDTRWVGAHGQVETDASGRPVRLFGTIQDITERRKAESERHELERLRAVGEFKTQFLSMAAHELNTPLTPLKAQLYLLNLDTPRRSEADRKRSLEILGRNLERLGRLVTDLLEAARIQSGRLRIEPRATPVGPLVEDVVEAFADTAQRAGIALSGRTRGDPVAYADATRVSQVLYNLVSNALKFTPRGGSIEVSCGPIGFEVEFRVTDTGAGLDADQISRLFQPFSRVHEVQATAGGTGLGLYISRTIVEAQRGTLNVTSQGRDQGSTFTVRLPMAAVQTDLLQPQIPLSARGL